MAAMEEAAEEGNAAAAGHDTTATVVRRRDLNPHLATCPERLLACPNRDLGCVHVSPRKRIGGHVATACEYTRTQCERGCGALPMRMEMEAHALICPHSVVRCAHGCGATWRRCESSQGSHDETCPHAPASCELCGGCVVPRRRLLIHLRAECEEASSRCRRCGDAVARKERWSTHESECLARGALAAWRARGR